MMAKKGCDIGCDRPEIIVCRMSHQTDRLGTLCDRLPDGPLRGPVCRMSCRMGSRPDGTRDRPKPGRLSWAVCVVAKLEVATGWG